jgi:hypothetical protein
MANRKQIDNENEKQYHSSQAQQSNGEENTDSGRMGGQGVMNKEVPSEEEEESMAAEGTGSGSASQQSRPTNR